LQSLTTHLLIDRTVSSSAREAPGDARGYKSIAAVEQLSLIFCIPYAFCRMPRPTTLPYRDRMLGTVAFRAALMMGAILLVGGIAFLMFFDGDVFTASIFSFLPAAIVSWFGLAVRTFFVKD